MKLFVPTVLVVTLAGIPQFTKAQDGGDRVAITSEFTYQGRLVLGGVPVEDPYDFEFTLLDCTTLAVVAGPIVETLDPVGGLFTTNPPLNFGFAAWNGDERCLRIRVRPAGVGPFVALAPIQEVTPTPYALRAVVANAAPPTGAAGGDLTGNYPNPTVASNAIGSAEIINGSVTPSDLSAAGAIAGDVLSYDGATIDWRPDDLTLPYSATVNTGAVAAFAISQGGVGRTMVLDRTNAGGGNHLMRLNQNGDYFALGAYSTGTGGAYYGSTGSTTNEPTMYLQQNGTNVAADIRVINAGSSEAALYTRTSGTGPAALLDGRVQVGSNTTTGELDVYTSGLATPLAQIWDNGPGGELILNDDDGSEAVRLGIDYLNDDGSQLLMSDHAGSLRFAVAAELSGNGEPFVNIAGTARSATFNMASSGSASVNLPTDAIQDSEILDEPGVASAAEGSAAVSITSTTPAILAQQTITAPATGFVLVLGTCQFNVSHTTGTTSSYNIGVSDASGSLPTNQDVAIFLGSASPTMSIDVPASVHGLFSVSSGAHTFYLLGEKISSTAPNASVNDTQLTLVYLPTSYGTVEPTLARSGPPEDESHAPTKVWTADLQADSVAASLAANQARIERELAETRAEMQQMRALIEAEHAGHSVAPAPISAPKPAPVRGEGE